MRDGDAWRLRSSSSRLALAAAHAGRLTPSRLRRYRDSTCCSRDNGRLAQTSVFFLTSSETPASAACESAWARLQCAVCHPQVGTAPAAEAPVCSTFCDSALHACEDEFFSLDAQTQLITPCRETHTVCARLREWAGSGAEFCEKAGFTHRQESEGWCFAGDESQNVASKPSSRRASSSRSSKRSGDKSWRPSSGLPQTAVLVAIGGASASLAALLVAVTQRPAFRRELMRLRRRAMGDSAMWQAARMRAIAAEQAALARR